MRKIIYKCILKLDNLKMIKLSDEEYIKMKYYINFNKELDLNKPQTLNEKLQWLKINDHKDIYTKMVDKYEAKKYVSKIIGSKYIINTLGIYDKFDDIDFENLPSKFVIKCTHDSGGVVICRDKSQLDIKKIKKKINKSLKRNYYILGREWPYKNVRPRIIVEEYIDNNDKTIVDYKFQTFNGKVAYSFVCTNRDQNVKYTFFDKEKKFINVRQCEADNDPKNVKLPENYDEMVKLAEILAKGITEVRVDFYSIKGKIYFGELTFFDSSGFGKFEPEEWDYKFGQMLDLSKVNNSEK